MTFMVGDVVSFVSEGFVCRRGTVVGTADGWFVIDVAEPANFPGWSCGHEYKLGTRGRVVPAQDITLICHSDVDTASAADYYRALVSYADSADLL